VLTTAQVEQLFISDAAAELSYFADADVNLASDIVANTASILGYSNRVAEALKILAPATDLAYFPPYLQILHYQCTIAEFFDHAATDMYEFSPRGTAALWLFERYPAALSSAGNPFLNNLKSVGTLDDSWVRSKKQKARPGARALLDILNGLESLQFAARRELAKVIRLWLHRVMRMSVPLNIALPVTLSTEQMSAILVGVAKANTGTYGVIEQRVIDAISAAQHPAALGWRSRGIGDSVNTTNISRRKFGDSDFQDTENRQILAYESHGGELTDVYVDEHLRTFSKVLALRMDELESVADLKEWQVLLIFTAHRISVTPRGPINIGGIVVILQFTTFASFIEGAATEEIDWDTYFLLPLSERRTPSEARNVLRRLAGIL
jgi:hypothetical protein